MNFSFLLRFQDKCEAVSELIAVTAGTQTKTAIPKEQPDSDPTMADFRSLPLVESNAGTRTGTRIGGEQGDADYDSTARTLPLRQMIGTKSATAIKMETADQAIAQHEMMIIPKCSLH